jgi:hypothetical protein
VQPYCGSLLCLRSGGWPEMRHTVRPELLQQGGCWSYVLPLLWGTGSGPACPQLCPPGLRGSGYTPSRNSCCWGGAAVQRLCCPPFCCRMVMSSVLAFWPWWSLVCCRPECYGDLLAVALGAGPLQCSLIGAESNQAVFGTRPFVLSVAHHVACAWAGDRVRSQPRPINIVRSSIDQQLPSWRRSPVNGTVPFFESL